VQLNVLQELFDVFAQDDAPLIDLSDTDVASTSQLMVLSASASVDHPGPKTMVFSGMLSSRSVSILLDSGSTHTFISEKLAQECSLTTALPAPLNVQVANGTVL
jgi:hypothetical protein